MEKDPGKADRLKTGKAPQPLPGHRRRMVAPGSQGGPRRPPRKAATGGQKNPDFGDFSSIAYFVWDETGTLLDINAAGTTLLGRDRSELIGLPFPSFVAPDSRAVFADFLQRVFAEQRQVLCEITLQGPEGTPVCLRLEGGLSPSGPEEKARCHAVAMDITRHVRTAEALSRSRDVAERLAGEMAAIAEIGRVIGSSLNIGEVYEPFAAQTRKLIPFDSLIVNLKTSQPGIMEVAYTSGANIPDRASGDRFPLDGSVAEYLMQTREGLLVQAMSAEEMIARFPGISPSIQAGMHSIMGVPLISKDEVIGTLMIRSKQPGAYREQDVRLAERIGAQIAGAMANAQLYTALSRTESSLRESEEKYRELVEFLPICVFESDASGRLVSFNRAALEMFRYAAEDLRDITDGRRFYAPEEWERIGRDMREVMHGASKSSVEYRFIRKDGSTFTGLIYASPIVRQGEKAGMRGAVIDITDRVRAVEELKRAEEHLLQSEKLAAVGRLAAGMAHEILNPVNIISLALQVLGAGRDLPPKVRQEIGVCMEQISRINTIAGGLKRFSRVQENRLAKEDLVAVVDRALGLCLPQLKMNGVQTHVDHPAALPMALMDRERIEQVILNLVTNAAAAMVGKPLKVLRVRTDRVTDAEKRDCLRVAIADTGTGIHKKDKAKLFEPFFTTQEPGKGTGLGLSISFGIIRDHGGRIWAEDNEWGGTSFFFEIPIVSADDETVS